MTNISVRQIPETGLFVAWAKPEYSYGDLNVEAGLSKEIAIGKLMLRHMKDYVRDEDEIEARKQEALAKGKPEKSDAQQIIEKAQAILEAAKIPVEPNPFSAPVANYAEAAACLQANGDLQGDAF